MNTTPSTQAATELLDGTRTNVATPVAERQGLTRRLITFLLAMSLAMASVVSLTSGPAAATHTTTATADVCFRHPNGSPYTYTVYAQKWNSTTASWQNIGSDSGTVNGCNRWNVQPGQYVKFQAFYRVGTRYFMGNSGYRWIQGGAYYNYGTSYVYMY